MQDKKKHKKSKDKLIVDKYTQDIYPPYNLYVMINYTVEDITKQFVWDDGVEIEPVNIEALINGDYGTTAETDGLLRTIHIGDYDFNKVEKIAKVRYGNPSNVRMEIRYGKDTSLFKLQATYIDYIKTPQHIRLTQSEIDLVEDHS